MLDKARALAEISAAVSEGVSLQTACDEAMIKPATYRRWAQAYRQGGPAALEPQAGNSGRPRIIELSAPDIADLQALYLRSNRAEGAGSMTMAAHVLADRHDGLAAVLGGHKSKHTMPVAVREAIERVRPLVGLHREGSRALQNATYAPGLMRLAPCGTRRLRAGEQQSWDDATINFGVCVPWPYGGDKCSDRYDVRLGRFQLLLCHDDATSYVPSWTYVNRRAELLIRLHGFQAYSASAYGVMDRQRDTFPFWMYRSMGDTKVRDSHRALNGKIFPAGSTFWGRHYPPWEWGCRCQTIPLMDSDVAEIRDAEKDKPLEERRVMAGEALKQVEEHGRLVSGPSKVFDLRTPIEKGKPGGFEWSPADLRLTPDMLKPRYDAQVWDAFEAWARATQIPDGPTVWEWIAGKPLVTTPDSHDNTTNDYRPESAHGIEPRAAASDLRRILEAGGNGEGIIAQQRALSRWGKDLPADLYLEPSREGGLEHRVWPVGPDVLKVTYGGAYGRTVRRMPDGTLALRPATALEYLRRWDLHNSLFADITRLLGVVTDREGPRLVIAQRALRGPLPDAATVSAFLRAGGWSPLKGIPHAWISLARRTAIFDARPANFVLVGDTPDPFDLIPVPLDEIGL